MAPPENMASDGSIIQVQHFRNASLVSQRNEVGGGGEGLCNTDNQVACTSQLYKVFERC